MISSAEKAVLTEAWDQAGGCGAARLRGARRCAGLEIDRAGSSERARAAAGDAILLRRSVAGPLGGG